MWRAFRDAFVAAFREASGRAAEERARQAGAETLAALERLEAEKAELRKRGGLAAGLAGARRAN